MLFAEVRDTDRARAAVDKGVLDRLVCGDRLLKLPRDRLVQEEEVDVVESEATQAAVEADESLVMAVVADPELRRDEHLAALDPGTVDRLADFTFVPVGGSGVDQAVAGCNRALDGGHSLLRRALEDAEAEHWHLDAVVQHKGRCCCPAHAVSLRRRAPMELDRHAGDDSQPRSSPANPKARRTRRSSRPPPPRATRPRPSAQTGVGRRGCEAPSSSTSASTSWRRPAAASVPARAARG